MNLISKFIFIFLVSNFANILLAWDSEAAKYFPLKLGNSWTYYHTDYAFGCQPVNSYRYKISITSDSVINGHRYFKLSSGTLYRIDSSSMNVYRRNFNTDCLTDSLLAKVGDHFYNCGNNYVLTDTNVFNFGGQPRRTRCAVLLDGDIRRLMYGIGLYSQGICLYFSGGINDTLKGCVIDGIVYGDTSVTTLPDDIVDFYPTRVGNVWVYSYSAYGNSCGCYQYLRTAIIDSVIKYGKTYYVSHTTQRITFPGTCGTYGYDTTRIDPVSGNILKFSEPGNCYLPHEIVIDSLRSKKGDSLRNCAAIGPVCLDTGTTSLFGLSRQFITFGMNYIDGNWGRQYVKGIGFTRYDYTYVTIPPSCYTHQNILGCVINGVVYGDTTFTPTDTNFSISGTVRYRDNSQPVSSGYVKAYRHSYLGYMDVLDSAPIQPNGTYILTGLPGHDTTDLMAFQDDEITTHDFVPTYYVSTIYWQDAEHLFLSNDTSGIDIRVIRAESDSHGSGLISGGVYGYYIGDSWKGISDARLYAISQNTFNSYGISNDAGIYSIDSLPPGSYEIICNRIGFPTQTRNVYLGNTNMDSINFYFDHLVASQEKYDIPREYALHQNYPNPFNPVTSIKFQIPQSGNVSLKIYDVLGCEAAVLINGHFEAGSYDVGWDAANYPSGVYFYRLLVTPAHGSQTFADSKKMVLIK